MLGAFVAAASMTFAVHAQSGSTTADATLHVSAAAIVASDANDGTEARPLRTVSEALARAVDNRRRGLSTRIVVHPGTYRESLVGTYPSTGGPGIVIEASVPGEAILSGSDVWTSWECSAAVCTHPWPYEWGFAANPWSESVDVGPEALRREMVFVDGLHMDQRLDLSEVLEAPGTFNVDEVEGRVTVHLPPGVSAGSARFEVAVRPHLMRLQGLGNLVVRGLVFQHAATPISATAVDIVDQANVTIENVVVRWSNWGGIAFKGERFVLRDSVATNNGGHGISAYQANGLLLEGNETSFNNWRGYSGGLIGWSVGEKFIVTRDLVIRDHLSVHNLARGLWIDWDNANVVIERLESCFNLNDGLFIEATQGPVAVIDSLLCQNGRAGIRTSATQRLELRGNVIDGNAESQIAISGDLEVLIEDWATGRSQMLSNEAWTVLDNTVRGIASGLLISTTLPRSAWYDLMLTAEFDGNEYVHPSDTEVFGVYGGRRLDFLAWQSEMLQDPTSMFHVE
jgi:hypothetical protein